MSVSANPFKVRDNELDIGADRISMREMLSVHAPTEPRKMAIRQAQLEALIRMVPATVGGQFVAIALIAYSLIDQVPALQLVPWVTSALLLCVLRGFRAWRLRENRAYARSKPADAAVIVRIVALHGT